MPATFLDLAMTLDPTTGLCDLVFDGTGFAFDATAATPMLISIGTERRADPDDVPPGTRNQADTYAGGAPSARRGWTGDGLDPNGARIGSRLWLLDDAKEFVETRQDAIDYALEAVAWMRAKGATIAADASWIRRNVLAVLVQVDSFSLRLPVSVT